MSKQTKAVVACIDGSPTTTAVCDYASWIASTVDAPLKLLHTIENQHNPALIDYTGAIGLGSQEGLLNELTELEQNRRRLLIKKGQLMLNAAKERAQAAGVDSPELLQRHGSLVESLVDLEADIRVLVLGIRGEGGAGESTVGTHLETVIRALHKPILVVNGEFSPPKTAMLACDGSEACSKALALIASSPLFRQIPCHAVHVGKDGDELLEVAAARLQKSGVEVITAQLEGKTDEVLPEYQAANDIDITLMGAFSHSRVRDFLLGSFTAKMLASSKRPLLLLR